MITRKAMLVSVGILSLAAFCVPAMAHDWSFGFSFGHGPRYYAAPAYVYRDYTPLVYSTYCAPDVVVYDPPPRFYYFRECAPRTTVVYRDYGPHYFRSHTTHVREPAHRFYRFGGYDRSHVRVRVHR
jgi:hypothetical protein